jgi:hypothetical protein
MTSDDAARVILAVATEADHKFIWSQLNAIQTRMFEAGRVAIKFGYFGGEVAPPNRPFVISTRWATDPDDMADLMDDARVHCQCGCYCQVDDILAATMEENRQAQVQALIIVSDFWHGTHDDMLARAKELRAAGTRVFLLQQVGDERWPSSEDEAKFRALAQETGGAFFRFSEAIERVAQRLPYLLEAVSCFAIGGRSGLEALGNDSADLLLDQIDAHALTQGR